MENADQSPRDLARSLRRHQRKHAELLTKVEKTTARLERRTRKLQVLEAVIAEEERNLSEPRREDASRRGDNRGFQHARLIFNPSSGPNSENNAERLAEVVSALRAHGIEPHVGIKTSGKAARVLARKAAKSGQSLVVVAGGDGTIADVASQLVGSSTVLGIIPIGTMNNIARSTGVPLNIDDACALIGMGTTRHIDMGRLMANGSASAEYFVECAGVGLTAIMASSGQSLEKRRWHNLPGLMRKYAEEKLGTMRVEMDDVVIEAGTRMITISNTPLMGSNMLVSPGAKMDDGYLDVRVYDGMGDAALAKHFLAAASGNPPELKSYRARKIRVVAEEPVSANSDLATTRPRRVFEIEIVPQALLMIVGNGIGLSVPVESAPKATTLGPAPTPTPHTNGTDDKPLAEAMTPNQ